MTAKVCLNPFVIVHERSPSIEDFQTGRIFLKRHSSTPLYSLSVARASEKQHVRRTYERTKGYWGTEPLSESVARKIRAAQFSVADGFAGAAFIVAALQPAIAEQNGFDPRDDHRLCFFDGIASFLEQGDGVR